MVREHWLSVSWVFSIFYNILFNKHEAFFGVGGTRTWCRLFFSLLELGTKCLYLAKSGSALLSLQWKCSYIAQTGEKFLTATRPLDCMSTFNLDHLLWENKCYLSVVCVKSQLLFHGGLTACGFYASVAVQWGLLLCVFMGKWFHYLQPWRFTYKPPEQVANAANSVLP